MSFVSYWSLIAMTTPWSGPTSLPVRANAGPAPLLFPVRRAWSAAAVGAVGHAARLAGVESPSLACRGPEVQRREGVDLPGVRDGRDRAEDALRLVHAGAVIGLDALQILLDDADRGRDAPGLNGALDVRRWSLRGSRMAWDAPSGVPCPAAHDRRWSPIRRISQRQPFHGRTIPLASLIRAPYELFRGGIGIKDTIWFTSKWHPLKGCPTRGRRFSGAKE